MRGRDGLSGLFQSFQGFGGISVRLSKTFSGSVYLILIPFRVLVGFLHQYTEYTAPNGVVTWFQSLSGFL